LWTPGRLQTGEQIATATILTTSANTVVARLHDRMPVILPDRASELEWLSADLDATAATALCVPLAAERLTAAPANPTLNKAGVPEGPQLLVGA
jgi:putative SOS response-associated peptidase YedK